MATAPAQNDDVARENWARYLYGKDRGHKEYTENAARCEGMYLGGGEQWSAADKALLDSEGRPHYEFNEIMASVNSAIGYQIHNRMDIAYKPRGAMGDLEVATILSKVVKQVADMTKLHWVETQVFGDGLVEQRGYYELRMDFERNIKGEIAIAALDPRDVIPDPDAKAYDPDQWGDVIITRWLTLDEIEQRYGKAARTKVEESQDSSPDFGDFDDETERSKFGMYSRGSIYDAFKEDGHGFRRYRIIDRQQWVYELTQCLVYPRSGDVVMSMRCPRSPSLMPCARAPSRPSACAAGSSGRPAPGARCCTTTTAPTTTSPWCRISATSVAARRAAWWTTPSVRRRSSTRPSPSSCTS